MSTAGRIESHGNRSSWVALSQLTRDLRESGQEHVPTSVMLDYAVGGLDDELLEALYGPHLLTCSVCSRGMAIYREQRPSDPARLREVPEFARVRPLEVTYSLTPAEAGQRLRKFVERGSGPLLIVAGEANPEVYNPTLAEALRRRAHSARRAGLDIPKVICGPAMGLNGEVTRPDQALLPGLAEEGVVELFIAAHRQRLHFRVSGEDSVYTEEYHPAGNRSDRRGYWYKSRAIAGMFARRFQALVDTELAKSAGREDFVYLSMGQIREIEEAEGRFDSLTANDLRRYAA